MTQTKQQIDEAINDVKSYILSKSWPWNFKNKALESFEALVWSEMTDTGIVWTSKSKIYIRFPYSEEGVDALKTCKISTGTPAVFNPNRKTWSIKRNPKTEEFVKLLANEFQWLCYD